MKIAFLGTGMMGAGFVRGLIERGHEVTVWNRTAAKAQALAADGARVAPEPAVAARGAERVRTPRQSRGRPPGIPTTICREPCRVHRQARPQVRIDADEHQSEDREVGTAASERFTPPG